MARIVNIAAFSAGLLYIIRLRRELAAARSRGDMYRDIAASLDRQSATKSMDETRSGASSARANPQPRS